MSSFPSPRATSRSTSASRAESPPTRAFGGRAPSSSSALPARASAVAAGPSRPRTRSTEASSSRASAAVVAGAGGVEEVACVLEQRTGGGGFARRRRDPALGEQSRRAKRRVRACRSDHGDLVGGLAGGRVVAAGHRRAHHQVEPRDPLEAIRLADTAQEARRRVDRRLGVSTVECQQPDEEGVEAVRLHPDQKLLRLAGPSLPAPQLGEAGERVDVTSRPQRAELLDRRQ